jgi:phage terminase small subunit
LLLPHQLDEDTAAAVASFKIDEYGRIEYKFWNKVDALDKLMRHLGLYERDNAQQPPPVIREIRLVPLQPRDGATPAGG